MAVGVGVHVGVTLGGPSVGVTAGVGVQLDPRQGGATIVAVAVGGAAVAVAVGVGVQSDPRQGGDPTVGVAASSAAMAFELGTGDNLLEVVFICRGGVAAVAAEVSRLQTTSR